MAAGWAWCEVAEAMVVYLDGGLSPGMDAGIKIAQRYGLPVEYRWLMPPAQMGEL